MQPFAGFAPDADPTTPGVVTDCEMLEPSVRGMRGAPSLSDTGLPALAAAAQNAVMVKKLDGTRRLLAATQTKLYEAGSASWTDVSSATTYTGSADGRWRFAQFGDVTLAVNNVDPSQSSSTGTFTALAGLPKATLITTAAGFVMTANLADASYAYADGWWCSALYDYTSWTPSIATQAARARLLDAPGAITALKPLGSDIVAFKEKSLFHGVYVGPDVIWAWRRIPGDVGVAGNECVVSDGSQLYWWGGDDFYRYDGSRPQPFGGAVRKWFVQDASRQYLYKMTGTYDRDGGLIRWYYVSSSGNSLDSCIVYNTQTGRWGRANRSIEAVVDYASAAITYDSPGILTGITYDSTAFPASYDSPFWLASAETPAVFDTAHTLYSLTGVSSSSSLTTWDFGADDSYTLLTRVRPRYSTAPTTASLTNYFKFDAGDALTQGATISANDGKFDVLRSARWHRVKFAWTGAVEASGFDATLKAEGER